LFTTLENVPLLNKSADANAITFESDKAIAILVGSWRCLGKDIMNLMLDHFKNHDIKFSDITVRIGPGLENNAYSLGVLAYQELKKVYGDVLEQAVQPKIAKDGRKKYLLNVPQLMQRYAEQFGFQLDLSENKTTFNLNEWKEVKAYSQLHNDPKLPVDYYKFNPLFSARLYARTVRLAERIAKAAQCPVPEEVAVLPAHDVENIKEAGRQGRYDETGRCLNGIMRRCP
jgi:copper oxidase (laccase) domain-containing protein